MNQSNSPSPDESRSAQTPEETRRLQDLCRQRRKGAERQLLFARIGWVICWLLYFGNEMAAKQAAASGAPALGATATMLRPFLLPLVLLGPLWGILAQKVRCPGCKTTLPVNPPRDFHNDLCDECGLQLTPATEEAVPVARTCPTEEAQRFQATFATHRRRAWAAQIAGVALLVAGPILFLVPFGRHQQATHGLEALDIVLMLSAVPCVLMAFHLLVQTGRVCCPACGETILQNQKATRRFCHYCAQPIRESVKDEGRKRTFHYECSCRPDVSQGIGRDGLSHLCHCPHCGVKLTLDCA